MDFRMIGEQGHESSRTGCAVRRADFRGWDACYLENDLIRLITVPDIGGRVMAYDLGSYPFLFVDPDLAGRLFSPEENQGDGSLGAWKNYGGAKTWPAPQGWENEQQWHGPPDPVLDTGRYRLEALKMRGATATVRMASPPTRAPASRSCAPSRSPPRARGCGSTSASATPRTARFAGVSGTSPSCGLNGGCPTALPRSIRPAR